MDAAWTQSMGAADTLGPGFTNDGAPVLDRATHIGNLPPEFRDAGTRLAGASRRLGAVAEDLSATMTADRVDGAGMDGELSTMATNWAQRVAAAGTQGGLIPQEAIPALLAERDRVAAQMVSRVGDAGRQVTAADPRLRGSDQRCGAAAGRPGLRAPGGSERGRRRPRRHRPTRAGSIRPGWAPR